MATERFGGGQYDFLSDVWSVGIITLEAFTGEHPYKTLNFIAMSMAVCKQASPVAPAGTPPPIAEFVRLCLIKEHRGVNGRPQMRTLVNGAWMKEASRLNAHQETERYLRVQKGLPPLDG
jgi:serine/threonine protein kinase